MFFFLTQRGKNKQTIQTNIAKWFKDQIFTIIKQEYQIHFIYLLLTFLFANWYYQYRAETCLWLLYMQNWISLHWRQYSQFQMQKETVIHGPREHMLLSYLPLGPTLLIWKSLDSTPCMGRLYTWVWGKPTACIYLSIYTACPVLQTSMEQISRFVITNSTRGHLV